jgi:ribose 1,5-bisphosphokinase PhnN
MKSFTRIFVVSGGPGSGKDALIQAVRVMGSLHAQIIPKHTSRTRRRSDGTEMICSDDANWALDKCHLKYNNHGDYYGIEVDKIWAGLASNLHQIVVVSNRDAINAICEQFFDAVVLIYVHSDVGVADFVSNEADGEQDAYVKVRSTGYEDAFKMYIDNISAFDHVVIYSGSQEDMFDQMFRIFKYYDSLN